MNEDKELKIVGKSIPRLDGLEKVTGQAVYGFDLKMPGMLYVKVLRSPLPHARILNLDVSRAEKLPGVKAVITAKSQPMYLYGTDIKDTYFLAVDKVRYVGEPVAAVAALSQDIAEEALGLIQVDYEELPGLFDGGQAMQPAAPLIHEELAGYRHGPSIRVIPGSNVLNHFKLRHGDVEVGFKQADFILEHTFTSQKAQHCYMEPHAGIARVDPAGKITLWTTTQAPCRIRSEMAEAFNLPLNKVRLITTYCGGGFGGKTSAKVEMIAAALAMKTAGRPVKMTFTREEEFIASTTRHPAQVTVKTGVKKDGTLTAREVKVVWDTGAYSEKGEGVSRNAGIVAAGAYVIPHVKIDSYCVYTNKCNAGPYRGFGDPQVTWAVEQHTDIIAEKLAHDPLELRLKNCYQEGSLSDTGETLYSVSLRETLEEAGRAIGWGQPKSGRNRGRGIACAHKMTNTRTSSAAVVMMNEDGTVEVLSSAVDEGQGSKTALAQIVAEELQLPVESISFATPDTDITPFDFGSVSSRITFHMGNALRLACKEAKERLFELAAERLEASPNDIELIEGRVRIKGSPEKGLTLEQLFLPSEHHTIKRGYVLGRGSFTSDDEWWDVETAQSKKPTAYWMYCAHGAEVFVDDETGEVDILNLAAAHDVGKAINPSNCQAQIQGCLGFGISGALMEDMVYEGGKIVNPSFMDYLIPTSTDLPPFTLIILELPHKDGPYGAKGLADAGVCSTAAAIANAIYDAVGIRITDSPITSEKVLKALRDKKNRSAHNKQ